jgi:nitrate reductase delta subunit
MPDTAKRDQLLGLFADILDYPDGNTIEQLARAEEGAALEFPEAGRLISRFRSGIEHLSTERLQEVFTAIFDLNATCHPYIGYQLFGETYKRSVFLVELKEHYRTHGVPAPETELADRFSIMLRFVSECADAELVTDIIEYGFAPSLDKMTRGKEPSINEPEREAPNPYSDILRALQIVLGQEPTSEAELILDNAGGDTDVP